MTKLTRRCESPAVTARTAKFWEFTDRAYRAVTLAETEAIRLDHNYIGTEHLLLAVLGIDDAVAAKVLTRLGVSAPEARAQILQIIGRGSGRPTGQLLTPRCKKVLQLAHSEARRLGHNYVGTEHLLLGLVREGHGVAAQILGRLGADRAAIVEAVMLVLGGATQQIASGGARSSSATSPPCLTRMTGCTPRMIGYASCCGSTASSPMVGLPAPPESSRLCMFAAVDPSPLTPPDPGDRQPSPEARPSTITWT